MKVNRTDSGEETVITIPGSLDAITSPDLSSVVDGLVFDQRKNITLELSSLRMIDSSGAGVIISLQKRVAAYGGQVRFVGLSAPLKAIFKDFRLYRVFPT